MAELLRRRPVPDAVFCFTDELALGALRTLADHGLRVPEDVALVGFDDIEDGRYSVPTLTTVSPDKDEIAQACLDRLGRRLADRDRPPSTTVASYRLEVRQSTGG
jgi:DNA-binding LacI/PurR family transcriptional regulator